MAMRRKSGPPRKNLPTVVGRYFDAWILPDTWSTGNPHDETRFYRFVKAVLRYCKRAKRPGEGRIRQLIETKGRETVNDPEYLSARARYYANLYASILEFDVTPFPDPLTERTSPNACLIELEYLFGYENKADIERGMIKAFGDNWALKLEEQKRRA